MPTTRVRRALSLVAAGLLLTWARAASAQSPAPSTGADAATSRAPSAAAASTVVVHVDSPTAVDLEAFQDGRWVGVCTSPCDRALPTNRDYRIGGFGIRSSRIFSIAPGTRATLTVDPASSGAHGAAVVVTVIGVAGLVPGAGVTAAVVLGVVLGAIFVCPIVAAFSSKNQQNNAYTGCLGDDASYFGKGYASPYVWGPALVGGVALVLGVTWLVAAPSTTVTLPTTPAGSVFGASRVARVGPPSREPVWRTEDVALPKPAVTNFIDVRF
jgi:hypothetical protein